MEGFTKEKYSFVIIWKTRNIRSLLNLKDKTSHISSALYEGKCNCDKNHIGETGPNITIRWDEHCDIGKNSEPAKAPLSISPRQIQQENEAYYVTCLQCTLNNQLELTSFKLFQNESHRIMLLNYF